MRFAEIGHWITGRSPGHRRPSPQPPALERLEERCLLSYSITDLGTLLGPDSESIPAAINAAGDVVGNCIDYISHDQQPFVYSQGTMVPLGAANQFVTATGINASGQIVGTAHLRAFLAGQGTRIDLGTLGGATSGAGAINDRGQVVGASALDATGIGHAFLYDNGVMTDLGTLPGGTGSGAYSINNAGQAAGLSNGTGFTDHATLWDHGTVTDLGTLPGDDYSTARGISASGQVVGSSFAVGTGKYHAFLYENGSMTDLGSLGLENSEADAINASGDVVGHSYLVNQGITLAHAFLYRNGQMTDLNDLLPPDSGWTLYTAAGINDAGQIVGVGRTPDDFNHGYLLTPDDAPPPSGHVGTFALAQGDPVSQAFALSSGADHLPGSGFVSTDRQANAVPGLQPEQEAPGRPRTPFAATVHRGIPADAPASEHRILDSSLTVTDSGAIGSDGGREL